MRFWDTSALVPLLFEQESTARIRGILDQDPEMVAWWRTPVECASAAARLRREGVITVSEEDAVLRLLGDLRESWIEILPSQDVRAEAMRLLRVHSLRAADALQLGAAISGQDPTVARGLSPWTSPSDWPPAWRGSGFSPERTLQPRDSRVRGDGGPVRNRYDRARRLHFSATLGHSCAGDPPSGGAISPID